MKKILTSMVFVLLIGFSVTSSADLSPVPEDGTGCPYGHVVNATAFGYMCASDTEKTITEQPRKQKKHIHKKTPKKRVTVTITITAPKGSVVTVKKE